MPDVRLASATQLTPAFLHERGLLALILDLDNTLAVWNGPDPAPGVEAWLDSLREASIACVIVSNNGPTRVDPFAARTGVAAMARAGKPRRRAFRRALAQLGTTPQETAVVGDRLLMDVLGGNRAGLFTILVAPVDRRELWATRVIRSVEDRMVERLPAAGA